MSIFKEVTSVFTFWIFLRVFTRRNLVILRYWTYASLDIVRQRRHIHNVGTVADDANRTTTFLTQVIIETHTRRWRTEDERNKVCVVVVEGSCKRTSVPWQESLGFSYYLFCRFTSKCNWYQLYTYLYWYLMVSVRVIICKLGLTFNLTIITWNHILYYSSSQDDEGTYQMRDRNVIRRILWQKHSGTNFI